MSKAQQLKEVAADVAAKAQHAAKKSNKIGAAPSVLLTTMIASQLMQSVTSQMQANGNIDSIFNGIPAMPTVPADSERRPRVPNFYYPFNACVARPVNKA